MVHWTGQALDKNTLSFMMRRIMISEKEELNRVYINHSVCRASCITKLADSGVPHSLVMATSGHKLQMRRTAAVLHDGTH